MKKKILLGAVFFYCLQISYTQSIQLDPSFGNKGIVTTDFGFNFNYNYQTTGRQLMIQPDGKMYILIEAVNQSYITKRLADGSADVSYGNNGFSSPVRIADASAALQPDGKIVVAGVYGNNYTVARYNTDGTLDNSFATDGMRPVPFSPNAVAVQSDGKIIVAGSIDNNNDNDFAVARYNADGSADAGFSDDGIQTTNFGYTGEYVTAVAVQTDGKIIVAGYIFTSNDSVDFGLARYTTNGDLDNSFSGDGKQITDLGAFQDIPKSIVIQPDGKILLAGSGLARYKINGTLDSTFSGDGKQNSDFMISSAALQSDGKIVVAGVSYAGSNSDFEIARYKTNGSIDKTFDADGFQTTDFSAQDDMANSVVVQSDGKIIVAGTASADSIGLARYNTNGSLDNTFNGDGKITDLLHLKQGSTFYTGTAIQTDGKLVAAGYTWNGKNYDFAVARYNTNGTPDSTFDGDGKQTTDFDSLSAYGNSVAIQANGKIIIAGVADSDFAVVRYNTNGTLDTSFSSDGKQTTDLGFNKYDYAQSVVVQNNGKILVAGSTLNEFDNNIGEYISDFALVRYNINGSLDTSFSGNGKVTADLGFDDIAKAMAIQTDGRIVVGGYSQSFKDGEDAASFAIARFNTNGKLDTSFSGDGKLLTDLYIYNYGNAIAIQPDGKIILAGSASYSEDQYNTDFALARFNIDGSTDTTFSGNGIRATNIGSVYKFSNALAILPDGKIIEAGGTNGNFTLAAYNNDGTTADDFGENGLYITEASIGDDRIQGMVFSDDALYAAGYGQYPGELGVVAKYLLPQSGALPLSVNFSGTLKDNNVQLNWEIANQQNLATFIIERSSNGISFSSLDTLAATKNAAAAAYSIIDRQPLKNINFYRLKLINADGKFIYSKIIAVRLDMNIITMKIFPNPAKEILFVQASGDNETATIDIIDAAGRKMKEFKRVLNKNTSFSIDINSMSPGMYTLILHKKGNVEVKTFIRK